MLRAQGEVDNLQTAMYSFPTMLKSRFIPQDTLKKITEGSFERLIEQLKAQLSSKVESLFGQSGEVSLVSTFQNHAIVLHEGGQTLRVRFERDSKGCPQIVGTEAYPLETYAKGESREYLQSRAKAVVEALCCGDKDRALRYAQEMLPVLSEHVEAPERSEDVGQLVISQLGRECPWKGLYAERSSEIHSALGEDLGVVDQRRLESKFTKLYDGSMSGETVEGYTELVCSDYVTLLERYNEVLSALEGHEAAVGEMATSVIPEELGLGGFALDLLEDLRQSIRVLKEAESRLSVRDKSRVYDVAARSLYGYDITTRYVASALSRRVS